MFELFIARRYLRSKRKQVAISVITFISMGGVAAGVMALVVALAITNGFSQTLERTFLSATCHVCVVEKTRGEGIGDWRVLAPKLASLDGVRNVTAALYDNALARLEDNAFVQIKGVPFDATTYLPPMLEHLKEGSLTALRSPGAERPGVILGSKVAKAINATVGKPISLVIPNGDVTPFGPRPSVETVVVVGILESGVFEIDNAWVFMNLADVQRVFGYPDVVNSVELNLANIYRAPQIAAAAESLVNQNREKPLVATTWQEQNHALLNALLLERIGTTIVIGLMLIIAALNIVVALVMMVMEKKRDIAVLMSMGTKGSQIRRIFVLEGAMIGGVGTVAGLALGYLLCFLGNHYKLLSFDADVYTLSYVPLEPRSLDALWIAALAMAVSLLAAFYPARSATRISPVDSMRYE
ncbi:MAG: ABC transporter permease [Acidobacteriota bacterium]